MAGVATKSSLLAPLPFSLILVDHNELGQAVPGAETVEILEVIDHHKLGNNHTISPITFITSPVGSTCTLVAGRYRECGMHRGSAKRAFAWQHRANLFYVLAAHVECCGQFFWRWACYRWSNEYVSKHFFALPLYCGALHPRLSAASALLRRQSC